MLTVMLTCMSTNKYKKFKSVDLGDQLVPVPVTIKQCTNVQCTVHHPSSECTGTYCTTQRTSWGLTSCTIAPVAPLHQCTSSVPSIAPVHQWCWTALTLVSIHQRGFGDRVSHMLPAAAQMCFLKLIKKKGFSSLRNSKVGQLLDDRPKSHFRIISISS